jgi:transposase
MRRNDICLYLSPDDRAELQSLARNRNTPRKLVWRAEIVLATADGHGTFEIMRRTGVSKPTVWRWQARYLDEGVPGLKRDTETRARHRFERRVEGDPRGCRLCPWKQG